MIGVISPTVISRVKASDIKACTSVLEVMFLYHMLYFLFKLLRNRRDVPLITLKCGSVVLCNKSAINKAHDNIWSIFEQVALAAAELGDERWVSKMLNYNSKILMTMINFYKLFWGKIK